MKDYSVFISAGEKSADILGAELVKSVRAVLPPDVRISWSGLAGAGMCAAGVESRLSSPAPSAAGLMELLPQARRLLEFRRALNSAAFERPCDLAVLIDMPDLHLPLGRRLEEAGIRTLLYVPPQTWAWRSGRAAELKRCCSRVAVLFEFEKRHLARLGVEAVYVGHPLYKSWRRQAQPQNSDAGTLRVALLPGSRRHEIAHNLPPMLEAAELLNAASARRFEFEAVYPDNAHAAFSDMPTGRSEVVLKARSLTRLDDYDLALCGAGTVTLELAAAGTPFVLCHRVNALSYAVARRLLKTGLAAMPNILAGYAVAPELIQNRCRAENIAAEVLQLCDDGGLGRQRRAWATLGAALDAQPRDMDMVHLLLDMLDIRPVGGSSSQGSQYDGERIFI